MQPAPPNIVTIPFPFINGILLLCLIIIPNAQKYGNYYLAAEKLDDNALSSA